MSAACKEFLRGLAIGMTMHQHSKSDVARALGVTRQTIHAWLKDFRRGKWKASKPPGRQKSTSERSDRLLLRLAKKHNFSSIRELQMWRMNVSLSTIYRRLVKAGFRKRRPYICPLLQPRHKIRRLNWAMTRCTWRSAWSKVIFSDESRFTRYSNDRRITVWRKAGERFDDRHIVNQIQGKGGSVHFWGAIWKGGRSQLRCLRRSVNSHSYIALLKDFFENEAPPRFKFQDDNAPAHRSSNVIAFHEDRGTPTMSWPAQSPDMNPIEHVWDLIGRKIRDGPTLPDLMSVENAVMREWSNMSQEFVDRLIDSMPRRIGAVIAAKGGHTRY